MQVHQFTGNNGECLGYVVHKISYGVNCRASAWFARDWKLNDVELIDGLGRSRFASSSCRQMIARIIPGRAQAVLAASR